MMHPAVKEYIRQHKGTERESFNGLSIAFLENVWGPAFNYRFEGLVPEFPFKDFSGKQRYGDFRYLDEIAKTILEQDGFTTHVRDLTPEEFDDHTIRQNDLLLSGWNLLRFTSGMIINKPEICQRQLLQGIGTWHYVRLDGLEAEKKDIWELRKQRIRRYAMINDGVIKPIRLAEQFEVTRQTAAIWLKQLEEEGDVERIGEGRRATGYRLLC